MSDATLPAAPLSATLPVTPTHLLLLLDGSKVAENILPHGVTLARTLHAHMTLLHVLEDSAADQAVLSWPLRKAQATAYLNGVRDELRTHLPDTAIDVVLEVGPAAERIVQHAAELGNPLVLLSSHGKGSQGPWNLGSVALKVLTHAHTSLLLVRTYGPGPELLEGGCQYRRLLLPLDGSERAEMALPLVQALASRTHSQIVLARLIHPLNLPENALPDQDSGEWLSAITTGLREEAEDYLDNVAATLRPDALSVRTDVREGHPLNELHELIDEAGVDLVVMTAHGMSGAGRWPLGRVAMNLLNFGQLPLLLLQDMRAGELPSSGAERAALERAGH